MSYLDHDAIDLLTTQIRETLLPGAEDAHDWRELLTRAEELLFEARAADIKADELDGDVYDLQEQVRDLEEELEAAEAKTTPSCRVYERLASLTIAGAPARWEELMVVGTPAPPRLLRLTIWMEEADFQEHVDLRPDGELEAEEELAHA